MTSARKPHPYTTVIAAGAGARIGGSCMHRLPGMGVGADPFGANLNRRGISR